MNYETANKELEEIIAKLESGKCELSETVELFERGSMLAKFCVAELSAAKGRISIIKEELDNLQEEEL